MGTEAHMVIYKSTQFRVAPGAGWSGLTSSGAAGYAHEQGTGARGKWS